MILPATTHPAQAAVVTDRPGGHWAILQPDVTFSAGIAAFRADRAPAATVAAADLALYAAKTAGRDQDCHEPGTLRV